MRYITIVGAGQAGLQLGIGLLKNGYHVTLATNKTADEILNGHILSNQGMFDMALQYERDLGLNFYEKECPNNLSVSLCIADNRQKAISFKGEVKKPFQSIDQRLKFSRWLKEFEKLKGELFTQEVTLDELEIFSQTSDLVIVSTGKGDLGKLFERDDIKSIYNKPKRALACHYVKGMLPITDKPGVRANIIPGIGEYFTMPGLTLNGHCEMVLIEGIPGSDLDCWKDIPSGEDQLEISLNLLKKYLPWEYERSQNIELTDSKAYLKGSYTPTIRQPVFTLPKSGKSIFGIGDAIVLNDPIAGQGANNASKAAKLYLDKIIEHGNKPFNKEWMLQVFNQYWDYAKWATRFSNILLEPPKPHVIGLLATASKSKSIANTIANAFNKPADLFPWIDDAEMTKDMIERLKQQDLINQNNEENILLLENCV